MSQKCAFDPQEGSGEVQHAGFPNLKKKYSITAQPASNPAYLKLEADDVPLGHPVLSFDL